MSNSQINNKLATKRILWFTAIVSSIVGLGVFGLIPNNALEILSPVNAFIMWFCLFTVAFSFINLFNKTKVPGKKELGNLSYFSMIFSLGMGVGIMIYGFNEAVQLQEYPECRNGLGAVINHWTLIPWSIYVTVAIFEIYELKYNLLPKWAKTLKSFIYAVCMMLGIGTSFALSVNTISDSLLKIYNISIPNYALVILLGAAVTYSLLRGLHKGMKVLSNIAMILLLIFMIMMYVVAPSNWMDTACNGLSSFVSDFMHNNVYAGTSLHKDWTVFYDIWWLSWAPFVAPFIVTISKGRSIREIITYTIALPSILIFIYMSLGSSIGIELHNSGVATSELPFSSLGFHWSYPIVFLSVMCMFYITSSDSQSFTLDSIISKGSSIPILYRKIYWVMVEVLFVTILLLVGSGTTKAIQGLSFLAVPFLISIFIFYTILIIIHHIKKLTK